MPCKGQTAGQVVTRVAVFSLMVQIFEKEAKRKKIGKTFPIRKDDSVVGVFDNEKLSISTTTKGANEKLLTLRFDAQNGVMYPGEDVSLQDIKKKPYKKMMNVCLLEDNKTFLGPLKMPEERVNKVKPLKRFALPRHR